MRRFQRKPAILGLAAVLSSMSAIAEPVGQTSAVRPSATQQAGPATPAVLKLSDPILRNATLETAKGGALEVTFADKSKLSMGEGSQVVVDDFSYSGPGLPGGQAMRFNKGLFRFQSGSVPKASVKLETPTVSIGIRGTILRIKEPGDGTSTVGVDCEPGSVGCGPAVVRAEVVSKLTGQRIELRPGQYVSFDQSGVASAIQLGSVPGCN